MEVITRNLDASKFRVNTSFSDWLDGDRCGRASIPVPRTDIGKRPMTEHGTKRPDRLIPKLPSEIHQAIFL